MTYPIYGITRENADVKEALIKQHFGDELVRIKYIGEYWAVVVTTFADAEVGFGKKNATEISRVYAMEN